MAFVHGRLAEVTINSVNLSAFCDEMTLSFEIDNAEVTTFSNLWKKFIQGLIGGTVSIGGSWDPTTTTGPASAIYAVMIGGAAVALIAEPGGAAVNQGRTGSVVISSYEESATVDDKVAFSAEFQTTGAITFES